MRGGNGPVLLELNTYRYRGHSMSDPAKYRTREEVQDVREHSDPIEGAKAELIKLGVDEDKLKDIDKRIRAQCRRSGRFRRELARARRRPSSTPTCWWRATDGDRAQDARALADDGRGHARQVAGQGRRRRLVGDVLAEIETDKATMEFESIDEGTVGKILVPEGTENVKVGTVIAMLAGEGEDASATPAPAPAPKTESPPRTEPAKAEESGAPEGQGAVGHRQARLVRPSRPPIPTSRPAPTWSS